MDELNNENPPIRELLLKLRNNIERHDFPSNSGQKLKEKIDYLLNVTSKKYTPIYRPLANSECIDQTRDMIKGIPFTSESAHWPFDSHNRPYCPAIQVDLSAATQRSGIPLGKGLLQLFFTNSETWKRLLKDPGWIWKDENFYLLRIIPRHILETEAPRKECIDIWGLDGAAGWQRNECIGFEIEEWIGAGFRTDNIELMHLLDELEIAELEHATMEDFKNYSYSNDEGTFQFGVPYFVQGSYIEEAIEGWRNLVQLDHDTGWALGDGGTGQILYRLSENVPEFKFVWSCY